MITIQRIHLLESRKEREETNFLIIIDQEGITCDTLDQIIRSINKFSVKENSKFSVDVAATRLEFILNV
ncbi:hypothetical protein WN48_05507 [Eufriesea mexicana]|uniref:Uncharacterized protein n=1 Tax=Eufriesea mexicana TaxID=516756 RepID=A0A310SH63_9HYME|nr:hypothetical protein WN48_05507 [Eufriesea mexicana]